jgi:hypothetical protein
MSKVNTTGQSPVNATLSDLSLRFFFNFLCCETSPLFLFARTLHRLFLSFDRRSLGMERHEKQNGTGMVIAESHSPPSPESSTDELINASGHKQELERNFSLLSLTAVAITTGNTWVAIGGSVVSLLQVCRRI